MTQLQSNITNVPGIVINRDPPLSSGHCGAKTCKHLNHSDLDEDDK